jgi:hypothetical protein
VIPRKITALYIVYLFCPPRIAGLLFVMRYHNFPLDETCDELVSAFSCSSISFDLISPPQPASYILIIKTIKETKLQSLCGGEGTHIIVIIFVSPTNAKIFSSS